MTHPAENDAPTCPHVTMPRSCFTCGTGRFADSDIPPVKGA